MTETPQFLADIPRIHAAQRGDKVAIQCEAASLTYAELDRRARRVAVPPRSTRELRELQALKREHALLKEEHELLKKAIRFSSARRRRSSRSSTRSESGSR